MSTHPVVGAEFRFIETNGIRMRVAGMGEGPLVVLTHGWPESWYSWRHQMPALAAAGYHVVAPDMRGYGETDAPEAVESYDIFEVTSDVVGILDAFGAERAHLVGHDWGAMVAAHAALFHPDRFASLTLMSVPHTGRPDTSPIALLEDLMGGDFFYILYHNEPGGIAEAEYDADPRALLRRLYASPDTPRLDAEITDPARSAGGWIPRLGVPVAAPAWLGDDDLDLVTAMFERSGFRGGVNYYRNFDRNWRLTESWAGATIEVPTAFMAGALDAVIGGATAAQLSERMSGAIDDLRSVTLVPGAGHWVQQEAPDAITDALLEFLDAIGA